MSIDKTVVTISRKWDNPSISILVTNEGIGLSILLDDFLMALSEEMGNPILLVTKQQLLSKMKQCAVVVETAIKQESVKVI